MALAAACGDGAPVELRVVPVPGLQSCPRLGAARTLLVSALGESGEVRQALDATAAGDVRLVVPDDTRQITIEALGPGGEVVAVGASRPLSPPRQAAVGATLEVEVAMLPPDGLCAVGTLPTASASAQVVNLGPAALVATAAGDVLRYDLRDGALAPVALPAALASAQGLRGATVTALGPGRAVLVGGPLPAYDVYDDTSGFAAPGLFEPRAHHGAVALDASHVLVVGGCSALAPGDDGCAPGTLLKSSRVLDVTTGEAAIGPNLRFERVDPLVRVGSVDAAGAPTSYLIIGGRDADGAERNDSERIDVVAGSRRVQEAGGVAGATLATGAQLVVAASPATTRAAVFVDGDLVDRAAARLGGAPAVLVPVEDGRVALLGGDDGTSVQFYEPMADRWVRRELAGEPIAGTWRGASAATLDDGTTLIAGGTRDGAPTTEVWRFRPTTLTPWAASTTVTPLGDGLAQLVPQRPGAVERELGWRLVADAATDEQLASAVIAAPQVQFGNLTAVVTVEAEVTLIAGAASAADGLVARLAAGEDATLAVRRAGQLEPPRCVGARIEPWAAGPQSLQLRVDVAEVVATVDGVEVLRCEHDGLATLGRWGVGTSGQGAVTIATATLQRAP